MKLCAWVVGLEKLSNYSVLSITLSYGISVLLVQHSEIESTAVLSPPCPGALPPDLSLVVLGREGEDDYVFSILTGYFDPPEGVEVREGMAYNPYFPGGVIGMPQQLFLDSVEYEDGEEEAVA